jgi:hypothetical protein
LQISQSAWVDVARLCGPSTPRQSIWIRFRRATCRLLTLRDLAARSVDAKNEAEAWEFAAKALSANPYDIPFAVLYMFSDDMRGARAVASAGLNSYDSFLVKEVALCGRERIARLIRLVVERAKPVELNHLESLGLSLPGGFWGVSPNDLIVLPIAHEVDGHPNDLLRYRSRIGGDHAVAQPNDLLWNRFVARAISARKTNSLISNCIWSSPRHRPHAAADKAAATAAF